MDKISVSFECPNCHTNKMVRKQPEIKAAKITCPKCGQVVKLVFDVTADPQTAVATLMNVGKEPQAPEPQAVKKKETIYNEIHNSGSEVNEQQYGHNTPLNNPGTIFDGYNQQTPPPPPSSQKKTQMMVNDGNAAPVLREDVYICRLGGKKANKVVERYRVGAGALTIGRRDSQIISDIMFEGDVEMSRRSVEIMVIPTMEGTVIKLKVLKATNPIVVGYRSLVQGEVVAIHFGEIITLGRTAITITNTL